MSKYGEALQRIIRASGISKNSLHTKGVIDRGALNLTIAKVDNPGVESIEKYLKAFNATWHDWAVILDQIEAESKTEAAQAIRGGESKGLTRRSQKPKSTPRDGPSKKTVREKYA